MDEKRELLRHFLAALAYRTQKALRDAPPEFGTFRAAEGVRTPRELLRHMTSVLGYARTFFVGGQYRPLPLPTLQAETLLVLSAASATAAGNTVTMSALQVSGAGVNVDQATLWIARLGSVFP